MILEMNARPGLAIQLANGAGLLHRLAAVDALAAVARPLAERIELGRGIAGRGRPRRAA